MGHMYFFAPLHPLLRNRRGVVGGVQRLKRGAGGLIGVRRRVRVVRSLLSVGLECFSRRLAAGFERQANRTAKGQRGRLAPLSSVTR